MEKGGKTVSLSYRQQYVMSAPEPKEEEKKPEEQDDAAAEEKPKSGKGKKGEKPKKKKMSKKELARIKREKAEQEQREAERIAQEKQKQREKEEESRKRQEQALRLQEETTGIEKFRKGRKEMIEAIVAEREKAEDWEIFSRCDHSIDVRSEADVNTFIEQWSDANEINLQDLFDHIHQSNVLIGKLRVKAEMAHLTTQESQMNRCNKQIAAMQNIISTKLDRITAHHLAFSDKLKDPQLNGSTDDMVYGMWVNTKKDQRIKDVDPCTGVKIYIPNVIALYNLAIRAMRVNEHPFDEQFLFIDRLLKCDLLQLQAPAKKIGTITIRQPPHASALQKLVYPLKGVQKPCPPLTISMQLDPSTVNEYCQDATIVMIIDGKVDQTPISKCTIEENDVTFTTAHIGTFGLAVPRYMHFPFQFWEIQGQSPTSVEIYLHTSILELALVINGDGLVSMETPFQFTNITPLSAINFLLERGINLIAPNAVEGIAAKSVKLENVLHSGIADCAVGFDIRYSKHNSILEEDRAMLLVREKSNYDEESSDTKDEQNIRESHAILVKADHVVEANNQEFLDAFNPNSTNKDGKIHQHLLPMFFDNACEKVQKLVQEAPPLIFNSVLYFMNNFRLFSMTK